MNVRKVWFGIGMLAVVAGLWNCSDDDASASGRQLSYMISSDAIGADLHRWVVVTDSKGDVLDSARVEKDQVYTYKAPSSFTEAFVTLTVFTTEYVSALKRSQVFIRTYANMPFDKYFISATTVGGGNQNGGTVSLTINDFPSVGSVNNLLLSTATGSMKTWNGTSGGNSMKLDISTATDPFNFMISYTDKPRTAFLYLYDNVRVNGGTAQYAMSDFKPFEFASVKLPSGHTIFACELSGTNGHGAFSRYAKDYLEGNGSTVYLPYPSGVFTSYSVSLSTAEPSTGQRSDLNTQYYYEGERMPTVMRSIDGYITFSIADNVITAQQPKGCDVVSYDLSASFNTASASWRVYSSPDNQSIVIPVMPLWMTSKYGIGTFSDFHKKGGVVLASLFEYPELDGYADYLRYQYRRDLSVILKESIVKSQYQ